MVQHRYGDIMHDAMLYALLALARLHPDTLPYDIFLRFGSQDRFTVFSPMFAFMISHFDLAEAAAIMTFMSQAALSVCAWLVARRFMSPASALLGTGLLLALPGYYGSAHMFSYTEDFLTARLPAEALTLASLAAGLSRRMGVSFACILVAILIHPIIASAGVVMLLVTCVAAPRPRLSVMVAAALLSVALVTAVLMPVGPFAQFDPEWLNLIVGNTRYLFITNWLFDDWVRLGIAIAVLLSGSLFASQPLLRTVCACAIVCAFGAIALTWIWCDILHSILPTRMQLWRWVWLTTVVAVLLSPVIAAESWNSRSPLRRAALIFICSSLLLRADSGAAFTVAFSLTTIVIARWYPQFKYGSYILLCAFGFLTFGFALAVGDGLPTAVPLAGALFAAWWIAEMLQSSVWKASAFATAAAIACLAAAPAAVRSWTRLSYAPALRATFAQWRDQLPAHAEVLWLEAPVNVWYLLDRPSYLSLPQLAGFVFSRSASVALDRRVAVTRNALMASGAFTKLAQDPDFVKRLRSWTPGSLESLDSTGLPILCTDRDLGFVVTSRRVGPIAMAPITMNPDRPKRQLYIYNCKDFRGS